MRDLEKFIGGLHDYIAKAIAPILAKLESLSATYSEQMVGVSKELIDLRGKADALEAREPQKGEDGTSVTLEEVLPPLLEATRGIALPVLDDLKADFLKRFEVHAAEGRALVADAIAAIPEPKEPTPGKDGTSVTLDEVLASVMPAIEKTMAQWEAQAERRFFEFCQRSVDQIPKPKDGRDALGFTDASLEFDGKRTYALIFRNDEREIRKEVKLPAVLDAGFWNVGQSYEAGDGVTCGGSYWIAQRDTSSKPDPENPDWRKAVSKGRDARMVELPKREPQPVKLGDRQ